MTQETLLKVSGLKVAYGGIQAVKGASFEVHQGELVSLIGANGAGKTTTLKAITGIQPIAAGSVEDLGKPRATAGRKSLIGIAEWPQISRAEESPCRGLQSRTTARGTRTALYGRETSRRTA